MSDLDDVHNFGRKIKEAREAKGWTQADLANQLEVTQQAVQKWERRRTHSTRSGLLPRLCATLGLDVPQKDLALQKAPGRQTSIRSSSLDLQGLSDLQKACIKNAIALMQAGHLDDNACLDLLLSWRTADPSYKKDAVVMPDIPQN